MSEMTVSVVIPNYNGEELLAKNLPLVLEAKKEKKNKILEIIVVDDASTDKSVYLIRKYFPQVRLIEHKVNRGFAASINTGVRNARGKLVALLNTDVKPEKDFLRPVFEHFEKDDVFAVSFNEGRYGWAKGIFNRGLIEHRPVLGRLAHISFWASGGSAIFDKKKWEELGGFDPIYAPFYWEDVDISYRAMMQGWKIIWEPKACVVHYHEKTIGKYFDVRFKNLISERNQYIFFWKNISSKKLWFWHLLWFPSRLFPPGRIIPPFLAILKLPEILKKRRQVLNLRKIKDETILSQFE